MTFKEQIFRYVILKIDTSAWVSGDKLPTEHAFADMFDCSRLTARAALTALVSIGVLNRKQGSGYFVSEDSSNHFFKPVHKRINSVKTETELLENDALEKDILRVYGEFLEKYKIDLSKTIKFEKKYFKTKSKLTIYQLSWVNKDTFLKWDQEAINKSFTSYLSYNGIVIAKVLELNTFKDKGIFKKYAEQLGWKEKYPIKLTILYDKERWVEFSVKIMDEDSYENTHSAEYSYYEGG